MTNNENKSCGFTLEEGLDLILSNPDLAFKIEVDGSLFWLTNDFITPIDYGKKEPLYILPPLKE
ncbi:MAG: hypothetical protein K6G00_06835 [Treponema sp.]|nr:hypothetical protein [Treponema sp.]